MVLTEDCIHELLDVIVTIAEDIKSESMKLPKGSLYEPHRAHISGITSAYVKLAKKTLDGPSAEQLIHYLYFEFEKPISEYLGFAMLKNLPLEYMMTK